jgi:hypothetical protein
MAILRGSFVLSDLLHVGVSGRVAPANATLANARCPT